MSTVQETFLSLLDVDQRREYLIKLLQENECTVTFTKIDGSVRSMPCTLDAARLPAQVITESKKTRAFKPDVVSVFCTDKSEWRSFRVMNVTDIQVV
jgi:WYL_2, Sm-like SH3 beta-barrel fold